jgi:hypothetical protein
VQNYTANSRAKIYASGSSVVVPRWLTYGPNRHGAINCTTIENPDARSIVYLRKKKDFFLKKTTSNELAPNKALF